MPHFMPNSESSSSPVRRGLVYGLSLLLIWQPVLLSAQPITPTHSTKGRPTLDQAANGVPVVNIKNPNGKGVSQNDYHDFNVGQEGAILNNSQQLIQTRLGGYIEGNPNLQNGSASLILNEVVGSNPSALNGYLEVAGARADVVVANPNGISCNGCGFINTDHATLTTGRALMDGDGSLSGFDVHQGNIRIHGDGLNASNTDRFDLIARSVKVAADLHANELNVVTGKQEVDRQTLATRNESSDDDRPQFAIDSSELGGMYAGRIRLVANEDGVGVRLNAPVAAQNGDLQLSSNGNLRFSDASAKGNVQLASAQTLVSTGTVAAGNTLSMQARNVRLKGEQASARQVDIRADHTVVESGASVLGTESLGVRGNTLTNEGELVGADVQLQADNGLNNHGKVLSAGDATLKTSRLDNTGTVSANQTLSAMAGNVTNSGVLVSGRKMLLDASQSVQNSGRVFAQDGLTVEAGELDNTGQLHSGADTLITAADVTNTGSVVAGKALDINAENLTHQLSGSEDSEQASTLESGGNLTLTTGTLDNGARIATAGTATLEAGSTLSNQGDIIAQGGLTLKAGETVSNKGQVLGLDTVTVEAQSLENHGELQALNRLFVEVGTATNTGTLQANGVISLAAMVGGLLNQGKIESGYNVLINARDVVNDQEGKLLAGNLLQVSALAALDNEGEIRVGQTEQTAEEDDAGSAPALLLNASQITNQQSGILQSHGVLVMGDEQAPVQRLVNHGSIGSDQGSFLTVGEVINHQGAVFQSQEDLVVSGAESLTNQGKLIGHGVLSLEAQTLLNERLASAPEGDFDGTMGGLGGVFIQGDTLTNRGGATLGANGDMTLLIRDRLVNQRQSTIVANQGNLFIAAAYPEFEEAMTEQERQAAIDEAKTGEVINDQGQILALRGELQEEEGTGTTGNLTIFAHLLENKRPLVLSRTDGLSAEDLMEAAWEDLQDNLEAGTEQDALIHLLYNEKYEPVTQSKEEWLLLFDPDLYKLGTYRAKSEWRQHWVLTWLNRYSRYLNEELPGLIDTGTKEAIEKILVGEYADDWVERGWDSPWQGGEADHYGINNTGSGHNPLAVTFYLLPHIAQLLKQEDPGAYQRLLEHMKSKLASHGGELKLKQNGCGSAGSDWRGGTRETCDNYHFIDHTFSNGFEEIADQVNYPQAQVISEGDMTLYVDTLRNYYSQISAGGDLLIEGDVLENKSYELKRHYDYRKYTEWGHNRDYKGSSDSGTKTISLPTGNIIASIIAAGGSTSLNIKEIGNHTEELHDQNMVFDDQQYKLAQQEAGEGEGEVTAEEPDYVDWGDSDVARAIDTINARTLALLEKHNSLFIVNRNRNHPYLIETNPLFNTLDGFLGSGYLIDRLGLDPDMTSRRLGDSYYENTLIRDAVLAATGTRFLDPNFKSDKDQFQWLMENALAAAESMELAVGVSLSPDQINALQQDMVWLEEKDVAGFTVLVPVLYLAPGSQQLTTQGAVIAGNGVSINTDGLGNSGMIASGKELTVSAGDKGVVNLEGTMQAGGQLLVDSRGDIKNQSGTLRGNGVVLQSQGDIIHEAWSEQVGGEHSTGTYSYTNYREAGAIESTGDVVLNAGEHIQIIGSKISGENVGMQAAGNIEIGSLTVAESAQGTAGGHEFETRKVRQLGSEIEATLNIMATAGQSIGITASRLNAGGNLSLSALEGDILIRSAANEDYEHSHYQDSEEERTRTDHTVRQQQSSLTAGGDLTLDAGTNLTAIAAQLESGGDMSLRAGNELSLLAAQNSDYHLAETDKDGDYGSHSYRKDEVQKITNLTTELNAGGNLVIHSDGDQHYQAARLESGGDITLKSGGHITFESVKDLVRETHEKSSGDLSWNKMSGEGITDETLLQTAIVAQGNLAIDAAQGLTIDVKEINQATVSEMIDGMVANNPDLAWLKEAEARGDVDWQQVQEMHDSWDYESQSMGAATALVVTIVMAALTAGAASAAIGSFASAGSTMAAATATTAAGVGNTIATAMTVSAATTAVTNTINNGGRLDVALKSMDNSEFYQGLATTGLTAGLTAGLDSLFNKYVNFGRKGVAQSDTINGLTKGFNLDSAPGMAGFTLHHVGQAGIQAGVNTSVYGGSFSDAFEANLEMQGNNVLSAVAFNQVGNLGDFLTTEAGFNENTLGYNLFVEGGLGRTGLHALAGGAITEITSGDFASGAAGAGLNQLLSTPLGNAAGVLGGGKNDNAWRVAGAQLAGMTGALLADGDINDGAWIAKQADTYNRQLHREELKLIKDSYKEYAEEQRMLGRDISDGEALSELLMAALQEVDATYNDNIKDNSLASNFLAGLSDQSGVTLVSTDGKLTGAFVASDHDYKESLAYMDELYYSEMGLYEGGLEEQSLLHWTLTDAQNGWAVDKGAYDSYRNAWMEANSYFSGKTTNQNLIVLAVAFGVPSLMRVTGLAVAEGRLATSSPMAYLYSRGSTMTLMADETIAGLAGFPTGAVFGGGGAMLLDNMASGGGRYATALLDDASSLGAFGRGVDSNPGQFRFFDNAATESGGLRTYNGSYDAEGDFGIFFPTVENLHPQKLIDAPSGHHLAGEVLPGGTGTSLSGHGALFNDSGMMVVPEGTYLTLPRDNIGLRDDVAGYIERDDWLQLGIETNRREAIALANGLEKEAFAENIKGMVTWLPGKEIPNYQLFHPGAGSKPIKIYENSTTIQSNMPLSNILKENQGCINWAACTINYDANWFD